MIIVLLFNKCILKNAIPISTDSLSESPLSHSLFLPVPWKVNTQQGSEKPNVWVVGKCGKNYPLSIENNFSGKKIQKNKMPEGN